MDSAEFLDLLGNANRRRILRLLAQKPCYVTEISEQLGVSPKAVIDHLRKLEDAGLVESRTDDRRRKYFSISRHVSLEVTVSPYEFGTRSAYPSNSRIDVTSCRQVSIELESFDYQSDELGRPPDEKRASAEEGSDAATEHPGGATTESCSTEGAVNPVDGTGQPGVEAGTATDRADQSAHSKSRATAVPDTPEKSASDDSTTNPAAGAESRESEAGQPGAEAERAGVRGDVTTLARQLHDFEQLERELSLVHRWTEGRITELREHLTERIAVGDPRLVTELLVALAEEPHQMEELCRRLGAPPPVVEELLEVLAGEGLVRRDGRHWHLTE